MAMCLSLYDLMPLDISFSTLMALFPMIEVWSYMSCLYRILTYPSAGSRADVWRYGTALTRIVSAARGGCAALKPRFSIADKSLPAPSCSSGAASSQDFALVTAATCHHQLQLPAYSSAQVQFASNDSLDVRPEGEREAGRAGGRQGGREGTNGCMCACV